MKPKEAKLGQPEINIGLVGHVDHGKTSLLQSLSGKWADTHSEELKRGITIRLGYADVVFYKCDKCEDSKAYGVSSKCKHCNSEAKPLRKVSFVDAPGHETLMATMLSGAAIMDGALLLIATNEKCPQPQTKEHLMALNIIGIKNIIILQNKIDLTSREESMQNYNDIKEFVKGTIAENAPIIPISAQHNINLDLLIKTIEEKFKTPERDDKKDPLMFIARSFDINKPGSEISELVGGVLGGALKQGVLKVGDEIEIKPGRKIEREGKVRWEPVVSKIANFKTGGDDAKEIRPGGNVAVLTMLDPFLVKSDSLTGNVCGHKDKSPPVWHEFNLKPELLDRVVGSKEELKVEGIKKGEVLMLNVNSSATVGTVIELKKNLVHVKLKLPVCCDKNSRITISRKLGNRFRLIGVSSIV